VSDVINTPVSDVINTLQKAVCCHEIAALKLVMEVIDIQSVRKKKLNFSNVHSTNSIVVL